MKTFNKSILAVAVAAASFGVAAADATISTASGSNKISVEGVNNLGLNEITHDGFTVTFDNSEADLSTAKYVSITLDGAEYVLGSAQNAVIDAAGAGAIAATDKELQSITELRATVDGLYVDTTPADGTIDDSTFVVTDLPISVASIADEDEIKVTVAAYGLIGSTPQLIDSVSGTIAVGENQYAFATTAGMSATVDAATRSVFVSGADTGSNGLEISGGELTITDNAVDYAAAAISSDGLDVTLEGDFSFLDSDGDGELDSDVGFTLEDGTVTEIAEDFSAIQFNIAQADASGAKSVSFVTDGERELPVGAISAQADFVYEGGVEEADFSKAVTLANWKLEGKTGTYSYMPFYDHIDPLFFVTNKTKNDADVTVKAWDKAGNVFGPVTLDVQAKAGAVTKLSAAIESALAAEDFAGNGSLNVEVTVNASDVEFYGSYNANGSDRGFVPVEVK